MDRIPTNLDVLLSPVSPDVKLSSPRNITNNISKLSLSDGVQVGLGSFDENYEAAQTADWTMSICSITGRAFWRSRKTGNASWRAPSGLGLIAEAAPTHLLDKIFLQEKTKSRFSHIQSVHSTPLDLNNPDNFCAMIRVGVDVYKHVDKKSQRRFICFSSNLDRIMWSQSRSTYFHGKIKGFILTKDMLEILDSDSVGNRLLTNPMKTNQKECVVSIKATHRDLDIEFDTTELANAWSNALKYVLNMKESILNDNIDKSSSILSSTTDELGTINEGGNSFGSSRDGSSNSRSLSSLSKGDSMDLKRDSNRSTRSSSSPTLPNDTNKSLHRGFSMRTIGSFIKTKSGSTSSNSSQTYRNGSINSIGKKVKEMFSGNSARNGSVGSRDGSGSLLKPLYNIDENDKIDNDDGMLGKDNDEIKHASVDSNAAVKEIIDLKKEIEMYKRKIDVANICIDNLSKSVNIIMKSQFSGDVQKDMPNTPSNPSERLVNPEWAKNIQRFINRIANNNHLSRSVSNRSILLSGKDKDVLEQIRKMLLNHLKSSKEYTEAVSGIDHGMHGDDNNDMRHQSSIEEMEDEDEELVNKVSDVDLELLRNQGITDTESLERNVLPQKKSRMKSRKVSVKYKFNSNDEKSTGYRRRAVSTLLSHSSSSSGLQNDDVVEDYS